MSKGMDIELDFDDEMKFFVKHYYSLSPSTPNFEVEVEKLLFIANQLEKDFLIDETTLSYDEILEKHGIEKKELTEENN